MPNKSRCALCHQPAILQKSHIIPDFLYTALYDEKHRFLQVSTNPSIKTLERPTGLYERLFCKSCEGCLGEWESYAARVLHGGIELNVQNETGGFSFDGLDYSKFKLFGMSLLFRAGVSTRGEFSAVQLGPHEEKLRQLLFDKNPGRYWQYGYSIVFAPTAEAQMIWRQVISPPQEARYGAHHAYLFLLGAMGWAFLVSNHMRQADECIFSLLEDGRLRIRTGGTPMMTFLRRFSKEIAAANSARGCR